MKSVTHKLGKRVLLSFVLSQHIKDAQLMKSFISYLDCGRYSESSNCGYITVTKFSELSKIIIPFFQKYPLQGVKVEDFRSFCQAALLLENKEHLTEKGFEQILKLKQGMNTGRITDDEEGRLP